MKKKWSVLLGFVVLLMMAAGSVACTGSCSRYSNLKEAANMTGVEWATKDNSIRFYVEKKGVGVGTVKLASKENAAESKEVAAHFELNYSRKGGQIYIYLLKDPENSSLTDKGQVDFPVRYINGAIVSQREVTIARQKFGQISLKSRKVTANELKPYQRQEGVWVSKNGSLRLTTMTDRTMLGKSPTRYDNSEYRSKLLPYNNNIFSFLYGETALEVEKKNFHFAWNLDGTFYIVKTLFKEIPEKSREMTVTFLGDTPDTPPERQKGFDPADYTDVILAKGTVDGTGDKARLTILEDSYFGNAFSGLELFWHSEL